MIRLMLRKKGMIAPGGRSGASMPPPRSTSSATETAAQPVGRGEVLARAVLNSPGARCDRRRDELDQRRHVNLGTLALVHAHVGSRRWLPRVGHGAHLSHRAGAIGRARAAILIGTAGHRVPAGPCSPA